ncbi:hypothetical protein IWX49DRAFT_551032 [Phyllosticta citricarpa]
MRPPESLPSLLLFLLATIPSPQCVAATGSSNNIKDLVDAVVHPLNPRTLNQIIWPRLADPPGDPPPPPPDMLPDPATLDAVVGSKNLQGFNEALGGIAAGPITESGDSQRRYKANGNTFPTFIEAAQRTCEVQANDCTTAANTPQQNNNNDNQTSNPSNNGTTSQQGNPQKIELTIDKCEAQRTRCLSFQSKSASVTTFPDQSTTTSSSSSSSKSSTTAPPTVNATTTTTTTAASSSTLSLVTTTNTSTTTTSAAAPPPPGAGPTGTQLINLGPDPQFPMFDLLCDV